MLIKLRKLVRNQKGVTLVELLAVVVILGILAALIVPRFTDTAPAALTAKVATDLSVIDSAISLYQARFGVLPNQLTDLVSAGYLATTPPAPAPGSQLYIVIDQGTATYMVPGTLLTVAGSPSPSYFVDSGTNGTYRAALQVKTSPQVTIPLITSEFVHQ
ncbi:MAG: prepilin-type N-terminal cleavage/methylation domain-containing protein [Negativicutes bacterium]|nr:prepilin-type N-terminal cleavage/methylation domain-containing protein [Negativicutes bacterium]